MAKNRTTVSIDGQVYPVASEESVEHIQQVAQELDARVRELRGKIFNPQVALAFAALNLMDELLKLREAKPAPIQKKTK